MGSPAHISLTERLRSIEAEIAAGRAESALPRCQEVATLFPRALAVQRVLGEIYLALRRPREALAALDRALTGDPEDARACCARAIVHQMHGDQMAALAWYRRACDIRPEDATLRATYREMASALGQPPYQPGRVGLARLYLRGDLFTHAIREWESLIAENSDATRLEAHAGLVETLWRAGRAPEAAAWARRTLTNAPSCLKPLLIAGAIAHDEGRDAEAEPFLRRAADLDPDHRAARALFADRLGAGDTALGVLLWGEMPPFDGALSGAISGAPWTREPQDPADAVAQPANQRVTAPAERRVNRPLVTGAAGASVTRTDLPDIPAAPLPPPSSGRTGPLPDGFHSMFKETEGMLWNPNESDPDALAAAQRTLDPRPAPPPVAPIASATPATPTPPAAPFAAPAPFAMSAAPGITPPPAIAESGFALGDTEMRRAIRWVQWLQAQGARTLGDEPLRGAPSGSIEALLNAAPGSSTPNAPLPNSEPLMPPITSLPSIPSGPLPSASHVSGALVPPSSEDLRQMFAQLDPNAPAVDAGGVAGAHGMDSVEMPPLAPPLAGPPAGIAGFASALGWPDGEAPSAHEAPIAKLEATPEAEPSPFAAFADAEPVAPPPPSAPTMAARPTGAPAPDATIEDLDRMGAADGFTPFDPRPGSLAALAGEPDGEDMFEGEAVDLPLPPPVLPDFAAPEPDAPVPGPREPLLSEPLLAPMEFAAPEPEPTAPVAPVAPVAPAAPAPFTASSSNDHLNYVARLAQARGHRDEGALDEAIVEYRAVVRNAPDLLPDVLSDVEGSLVDHPEHPELHRLLGDTRIRQGDYIGAIESYNRATALQSLDTGDEQR